MTKTKDLKIKDNVDLKELEKFGFDLRASSIEGIGTFDWADNFVDDNFGELVAEGMNVNDKTRVIWFWNGDVNVDLLFDLIKADLVEKVRRKDAEDV